MTGMPMASGSVWPRLHQAMLVRLREHGQIDWSRASIDGSSVPSPRGPGNGPQPHGQRQAWQQAPPRCRCQRHHRWRSSLVVPAARLHDVLRSAWMRFQPLRACRGGHASGRRSCMRTKATTTSAAVPISGDEALPAGLPGEVSRVAKS